MQKKICRIAATMLTTIALASCGGNESREETWDVQASEHECFGFEPTLCLATRASANDQWAYRGAIDGFHYELGNRYQVRVRITKISNPPQDGSDEEVELEDVLAKTAVPRTETFEISVTEPASITRVDDTTYRLFNRRNLTCTAENCMVIEAARTGGMGMLLEFDHQNSPAGPMHLLAVTCTAPSATFQQTCLE